MKSTDWDLIFIKISVAFLKLFLDALYSHLYLLVDPSSTVPLVIFTPKSALASSSERQSKTLRGTSCLKAAHLPSISNISQVIKIDSICQKILFAITCYL